jgi:Flp pilus assembly protein protease CpaA
LVTWVSGGVVLNQAVIIFVAVTASYSLWKADWWGGADAKTAMTLVIAIPDLTFVAIVALVSLLGSGLRLVARRGEGSLVQVVVDAIQVVRKDVRDGERFPLVAVMAGALPIYLFYELVVP